MDLSWGATKDGYKFILAREQDHQKGPMRELYDLSADPDEFTNLAAEHPAVVAELEATLEAWIERMMKKNDLTEDPLVANGITLGADWIAWVKAHGYW